MQTKIDLGEALVRRVKSGDAGASEYWCLGRLGARQLFYGPINQVVPPAAAGRWADALLKVKGTDEALVQIAQQTGDVARDLPSAVVSLVRARVEGDAELVAALEGERKGDLAALGRVFGEALPSGLVFAESSQAGQ
jgi:hypothetical protein